MADFSLDAMGYYVVPKTPDSFDEIVNDILSRGTTISRVDPAQLLVVTQNARRYRLDFDDGFVYTLAETYALEIVSLDAGFDRTPRGRRTPGQALN